MRTQIPMFSTQVLATDACWAFLREAAVGRLAFIHNDSPEIFPINYVVDHGSLVFRTAGGTKLQALAGDGEVSFEADGTNTDGTAAWSVILKGTAAPISRPDELLDSVFLPLHPWEGGAKERFIRITPETITGRRFPVADPVTWRMTLDDATRAGVE